MHDLYSLSTINRQAMDNSRPLQKEATAMTTLETLMRQTVEQVRKELGDHNVNSFNFTIVASGRTLQGNPQIEYRLRDGSFIADVSGSNVADVVAEYKHRRTWNLQQTPLMIEGPATIEN